MWYEQRDFNSGLNSLLQNREGKDEQFRKLAIAMIVAPIVNDESRANARGPNAFVDKQSRLCEKIAKRLPLAVDVVIAKLA